jgi:DNA-binding NtrC family response regulator
MNLHTQTAETSTKNSFPLRLKQDGPREIRILIVSEDDSIAERLARALPESGFIWERARSITAACTCAKSGRFQVILTTPLLGDGSWRRLVDIAAYYGLSFVVILVATAFDIQDWAEALEYGAFDVLDALDELPKVAESTKGAAWAAYLKGAGHRMEAIGPLRAT